MLSTLATEVNGLAHGWSGLVLGYAVTGGPMAAAMLKGRAGLKRLLWSPVLAVPVTLAAGVAMVAVQQGCRKNC